MTGPDDNRATSWSLRSSLTRMLVLAALLPVLVFGAALLWSQWQRDRGDLLSRLSTGAQSSASTFDDFLDGHLAGVRLLAVAHGDDVAIGIGDEHAQEGWVGFQQAIQFLVG